MVWVYMKGQLKLEKGKTMTLRENEVDWKEIEQEFATILTFLILTGESRRFIESKQLISHVEARVLIKEIMRTLYFPSISSEV